MNIFKTLYTLKPSRPEQIGESDHRRPKLAADMRNLNLFRSFCWPAGSWHLDSPRLSFVVFFSFFSVGRFDGLLFCAQFLLQFQGQFSTWSFLLCFRVCVCCVVFVHLSPDASTPPQTWNCLADDLPTSPSQNQPKRRTSFRHRAFFFNPPTLQPFPLYSLHSQLRCTQPGDCVSPGPTDVLAQFLIGLVPVLPTRQC